VHRNTTRRLPRVPRNIERQASRHDRSYLLTVEKWIAATNLDVAGGRLLGDELNTKAFAVGHRAAVGHEPRLI